MRKLALIAGALLTATAIGCTQPPPSAQTETLIVVTHGSFVINEEAKAKFAAETGYAVSYVSPGDAGTIVNQLILSKDSPLGDVVYGIDNILAGKAISEGVLSPYASNALPASARNLPIDQAGSLTPVDYGDVCVNADDDWFKAKGLALPQTLDDLAKPEYKDLLVVTNPASSSPGLALLAATVVAKGDPGYLDYWQQLKANGVKVVPGWTQAYQTEFSGSEGKGPRPLVLSYSSSPMYEANDDGTSPTSALPQTCVRQIEYAGVIAGAANEIGARKFIDFMLSAEVQASIPELMYMSPIDDSVALPADWEKYASVVADPINLDPVTVAAQRDGWVNSWTETVIG
jgi:thiamine transport system substrate-binding protein